MTVQLDVTLDSADFNSPNFPLLFDWMLFFNINDQQTAPICDAAMSSAGADLITQIFHQDGTLIQGTSATSTAPFNVHSWRLNVAIPRAWSKLNRGDTIRLYFKGNNANVKFWVKIRVIYKEYFP